MIHVLFNVGQNLSMKSFFFYLKYCVIVCLVYGHKFKFYHDYIHISVPMHLLFYFLLF